nr:hypothetical protein [uncultured Celeribacter sp.]
MAGAEETSKRDVNPDAEAPQEQEETGSSAASDLTETEDSSAETDASETTAEVLDGDSTDVPESETDDALPEDEADETVDVEAEETLEDVTQNSGLETAPAPQVIEKTTVKRAGFVAAFLGGVICLGLGYGAAQFVKPDGWPFPGANTDVLTQKIADLETELADVRTEHSQGLASVQAQLGDLKSGLDTGPEIADLQDQLAALEDRLTTLEDAPAAEAVISPDATAAYERQLAEMREKLNSEIARLDEANQAALAEQAQAEAAALKAQLRARVDEGLPYAALLSEVDGAVPPVLSEHAATGISSVSALKEGFAPAARAALVTASNAAHEAGEQSWFKTALQTQLGLRSTKPKDGDDPDAVLSRAEQAVREVRFADAIALIDTLPDGAHTKMQSWVAQAQTRLDVIAALDELLGQ